MIRKSVKRFSEKIMPKKINLSAMTNVIVLSACKKVSSGRSGVFEIAVALPEQLLFPAERMPHDGFEIVELRPPVQRCADAADVGDHGHDVAWPPRCMLDGKISPGDAPHCLDGLQHGVAATIAAVQRHRWPSAVQVGQRRAMRLREVGDMDEVADT